MRVNAATLRRLAHRHGTPLLVVDCESIREQYRALSAALPGVVLHYALKPLPYAPVVATLRDLGACFDVATTAEIALVRSQRVLPERCIHTHPIKQDRDIVAALRFGIRRFVVDNPDEIAQVRGAPPPRAVAAAGLVPQSGRGRGPVPQVRLRARSGRAAARTGEAPRHSRPGPVVSRRLAGVGPDPLRRSDRRLPRAHHAGTPRWPRPRPARHRRRVSDRLWRQGAADPVASASRSGANCGHCRPACR